MKVNKAPEKIYIQPDAQDCWFMVNNLNNTLVEYTRTDAFIEKVYEFLKSYRQDTRDGLGYIPGIVNDETIEDFRKAMREDNL